jgi:hypothetical protein
MHFEIEFEVQESDARELVMGLLILLVIINRIFENDKLVCLGLSKVR